MAPWKSYKKKSTAPVKATTKKVVMPSKVNFNKMVKEEVFKLAETKSEQFTVNTVVLPYTGTSWNTVGLRPLSPAPGGIQIAQGSGAGDRLADSVRTRKCTLELLFYPFPYDVSVNPAPQPYEVIIWIFGKKQTSVTPTNLTGFFQNGDFTSDPAGTLVDTVKTINRDLYTVYKKKIVKLGYSADNGTGNQPTNANFCNNDFKMNAHVKIDCTKYIPSVVTYNDTTAQPTTRGVFYAIEAVASNGAAVAAAWTPIQAYINVDYEYVDF